MAVIQGAGAEGYSDASLDSDGAQSAEATRGAMNQVAEQLTPDAKEWFLAETVRVGMADGPLTDHERQIARAIAADLGMTQAQAVGVVAMAEQAQQQN